MKIIYIFLVLPSLSLANASADFWYKVNTILATIHTHSKNQNPLLVLVGENHIDPQWKDSGQSKLLGYLQELQGSLHLEGLPEGSTLSLQPNTTLPSFLAHGLDNKKLNTIHRLVGLMLSLSTFQATLKDIEMAISQKNERFAQWLWSASFEVFIHSKVTWGPSSQFPPKMDIFHFEHFLKSQPNLEQMSHWFQGHRRTWLMAHSWNLLQHLLSERKWGIDLLREGANLRVSSMEYLDPLKSYSWLKDAQRALMGGRDRFMCQTLIRAVESNPNQLLHVAIVGASHVEQMMSCLLENPGVLSQFSLVGAYMSAASTFQNLETTFAIERCPYAIKWAPGMGSNNRVVQPLF